MKVMVIVKAPKSGEVDAIPRAEDMEAMGRFNAELEAARVFIDGWGLRASAHGARVTFSGDERTVSYGPFPNPGDLVSGYWFWNVDSLEHAIEWVKKCPNPMMSESDVEIRPLFTMEDFQQG